MPGPVSLISLLPPPPPPPPSIPSLAALLSPLHTPASLASLIPAVISWPPPPCLTRYSCESQAMPLSEEVGSLEDKLRMSERRVEELSGLVAQLQTALAHKDEQLWCVPVEMRVISGDLGGVMWMGVE